jgi:hypothetical protein
VRAGADVATAIRLAAALERSGRFDEAWETLAPPVRSSDDDVRAALGGIAARNPAALLARLMRLDYARVRATVDLLIEIGQARNPAILCLAMNQGSDGALRRHARRALVGTFPRDRELDAMGKVWPPEKLDQMLEADERRRPVVVRWGGLVGRLLDRYGNSSHAAALLPWLLPLLAVRDPSINARALAVVRRLTDRDGPPLPVDAVARALERASTLP